MPSVLRRYCNVKKPFCAHVPGAKSGGMAAMLRKLQIPLTGHHHRGIDDSRNIAKIVAHLARNGVALDVTGGLRPTGLNAAREAALTAAWEAQAAEWAALMAAKSAEGRPPRGVARGAPGSHWSPGGHPGLRPSPS